MPNGPDRTRKRRRTVAGGLALLLVVGQAARASAETPAERRLRILEETLRQTQEELRELHRRLDEEKAASRETQKKVDEASSTAKTANADGVHRDPDYQLLNPLTISAVNRPSGSTNPTLTRFQLDALVEFQGTQMPRAPRSRASPRRHPRPSGGGRKNTGARAGFPSRVTPSAGSPAPRASSR
jgi:hypothetical protein